MKRGKTTTFLVELPLTTNEAQAKHLRAHLEAARCLYALDGRKEPLA